ncbi:GlsB/YeaQ/YmgE family stress response membrane protein [Myxococcaceae bacterium JPH2]|nr:GlsB/YeaQ/YmgE family stress response membrane protein [Myxococcaceae bacterium JPH2]
MGIIAFIIIGLIAGLIARAILPGRQSMGVIATTLLGMVGSLVGGLIGSLFERNGKLFELKTSGIIMSIVGAIIVLLIVQSASKHRRVHA